MITLVFCAIFIVFVLWAVYLESNELDDNDELFLEPKSDRLLDYIHWYKAYGPKDPFDSNRNRYRISKYLRGLKKDKPSLTSQIKRWHQLMRIDCDS